MNKDAGGDSTKAEDVDYEKERVNADAGGGSTKAEDGDGDKEVGTTSSSTASPHWPESWPERTRQLMQSAVAHRRAHGNTAKLSSAMRVELDRLGIASASDDSGENFGSVWI